MTKILGCRYPTAQCMGAGLAGHHGPSVQQHVALLSRLAVAPAPTLNPGMEVECVWARRGPRFTVILSLTAHVSLLQAFTHVLYLLPCLLSLPFPSLSSRLYCIYFIIGYIDYFLFSLQLHGRFHGHICPK